MDYLWVQFDIFKALLRKIPTEKKVKIKKKSTHLGVHTAYSYKAALNLRARVEAEPFETKREGVQQDVMMDIEVLLLPVPQVYLE